MPLCCCGPKITRQVVKPNKTFADDTADSLSGEDRYYAGLTQRFGLVYNSILDIEKLEAGLSKALDVFPLVAGRLDQASWKTGKPFVSQFNSGVVLECLDDRNSDATQPLLGTAWKKLHGLPQNPYNPPKKNAPLLTARLVRLHRTQQSVLFVRFSHLTGDFTSYVQFLKTWSHFTARPNEPVPLDLQPQPMDTRRNRLTKLDACDAETAKERMRAAGWDGTSMTFLSTMWSLALYNRAMELRVNVARFKKLKDALTPLILKDGGEWVSTFEVILASFLTAKAAAADSSKPRQGFNRVEVTVNLRGRVPEDPAAYPNNYFGNALADTAMDLSSVLGDVSPTGDHTSQLATVARKLHEQLRGAMSCSNELCADTLAWEAGMNGIKPAELDKLGFMQIGGWFGRCFTGKQTFFSEWTSPDPLSIDFGTGRRAAQYLADPNLKHLAGFFQLCPWTETDYKLPCAMRKAEAARFLEIVKRWDLPFDLIEQ